VRAFQVHGDPRAEDPGCYLTDEECGLTPGSRIREPVLYSDARGVRRVVSPWLYRLAVLAHIAGVVVWMGAVAYYLLILRPALHMSGIERKSTYPLLAAIKVRLRWVVGGAIIVIVASGSYNAHRRGLLGPAGGADEVHRHVFWW
jgi:hypothetical protein